MTAKRFTESFALCTQLHKDSPPGVSLEAEQIYVQFLLVAIHAEFETMITEAIEGRIQVPNDPALTSFLMQVRRRTMRTIRLDDLRGMLALFGEHVKKGFTDEVAETSVAAFAYITIESNRQAVAHRGLSNLTLAEVQQHYDNALKVVQTFCRVVEESMGQSPEVVNGLSPPNRPLVL